jgi:hypothetical protein
MAKRLNPLEFILIEAVRSSGWLGLTKRLIRNWFDEYTIVQPQEEDLNKGLQRLVQMGELMRLGEKDKAVYRSSDIAKLG